MTATSVGGAVSAAPRTRPNRLLAIARLGRRTVRGGGWRHLLVVAMIGLVVMAATVVAIGARSTDVPDRSWLVDQVGTVADARIQVSAPTLTFDDLPDDLQQVYLEVRGAPPVVPDLRPVPSIVEDTARGSALMPIAERWTDTGVQLVAVDLDDPLAEGLFLRDGSVPGAGEVLLSTPLLERLDAHVGATVDLPDVGEVVVVGTVTQPSRYLTDLAVLPEGTLGDPTGWLVDTPTPDDAVRLSQVFDAERAGIDSEYGRSMIVPGAQPLSTDSPSLPRRIVESPSFVGSAVGALLGIQVAFVAAAAFATGTRRRLRQFGLLSAGGGATPGQVRTLVMVEAAVLGIAASVIGVLAAIPVARFVRPLMEAMTSRVVPDIVMRPLDLLGPAAVGVAAAVLAAAWPARTLARTSASTALEGRLPLGRVPRWVTPAAALCSALGVTVIAAAATGSGSRGIAREATFVLGVGMLVTGVAALGVPLLGLGGRLADRLSPVLRLAVRDADRQRTRSGAAVAALVVVVMLPTLAVTAAATDEARWGQPDNTAGPPTLILLGPWVDGVQLPATADHTDDVVDHLPVPPADRFELSYVFAEGQQPVGVTVLDDVPGPSGYAPGQGRTVLATDEVLARLDLPTQATEALGDGDLVELVQPGLMTGDQRDAGARPARLVAHPLTREARDGVPTGTPLGDDISLLAVETDTNPIGRVVLVPPATARDADLDHALRATVVVLPRLLTHDEVDGEDLYGDRMVQVETPYRVAADPGGPDGNLVAVAAAIVVALLVVGITTALAATESDRDLAILSAVGAGPSTRRRFHGLQAAYHSGLAAVLGVPAGLLLYRAGASASTSEGPTMVVAWWPVLGLLLGLPLVVGVVMWLVTRSAPSTPSRRIA
ncbi:putative ABC transporter integral membrane protein [Euzebya pacifica]|uniref:Putative ABC transporter integral membrane protein n=1 Tax=Euzebya pacifica TaxID=1608957 RepID=A0A346Y0S3_9ACTN|nr:ABC transporter permease [Euzebya pacifica]AXV08070.1 putative ABC transporter integral membrane protein [Euzebya pacifica]